MLQNYLKTALRALRKRPGFTAINVIGLGIGIAASILIALYARHELTYDRFHENADRIHQVYKERDTPTGTQVTRDTWMPLLPRLQRTQPAVQSGARVWMNQIWVEHENQRIQEQVAYADSTLLDVFSFPLKRGDTASALDDPKSAVITPTAAQRHFGDADPLGKTLTVDFNTEVTVTGILEPLPSNSTLQFDVVVPIRSAPDFQDLRDDWGSSFLNTFVLLEKSAEPSALETRFPELIASIFDEKEAGRTRFRLQPLPTLQNAMTGNRDTAYILLGIAAAILLIASINFTNLSTARSLERAREIGVRKSLGAQEGQLAGQFLAEAVLTSLGATVVGVLLAQGTLPFFNGLYDIDFALALLSHPVRLSILLGVGIVVGLAAGSYPAWVLTRFDPVETLRGSFVYSMSGHFVRRGLVVLQFALSMILIVATLGAWQQIDHMQSARLGLDAEQLVSIDTAPDDFADPEAAQTRLQTFEQEVERLSGVQSASFGSHVPGNWPGWFTFVYPGDATVDDERLRMRYAVVGEDYFQTQGIAVRQGRTFEPGRSSDSTSVVLNEAALQAFGWPAIDGKQVRLGETHFDVVGVVDNYHYEALSTAVDPVVHLHESLSGIQYNNFVVRLTVADAHETMAQMRDAWQAVDPSRAMPYTFVDDRFQQLYESEEQLATVVGAFTVLAIIVACLGLLGLTVLTVARREKEIGIRKALGASVPRVAATLSTDYLLLVGIAVLLAMPVAYWMMHRWLQDFAVRIDLGPGLFLLAGLLAMLVAGMTVGLQTIRAARLDPATTLRDD